MRIGLVVATARGGEPLEHIVERVRTAANDGLSSVWLTHGYGFDALTLVAVIGQQVPHVELGTAVVVSHARHPVFMAQQALTVQNAVGGRLTLGLGVSHRPVIEGVLGLSFDRPGDHMDRYLEILTPLLRGEPATFPGAAGPARAELSVPGAAPVPLLLAAMGPRMLERAGTHADGTITWLTGLRTIATHIVPTIRAAAVMARRATPRIVVALPLAVTDHPDTARALTDKRFQATAQLPTYRAMLDREGVAHAGEIAIAGDEATVADAFDRLEAAGVTDLAAIETFADAETAQRTRQFLSERNRLHHGVAGS